MKSITSSSTEWKPTIFIFTFNQGAYKELGCFADKHPARAIPTLEENDKVKSVLTPHYKRRDYAIEKCYGAAKFLKFNAFAVQDGGQCFASKNTKAEALKYGKSTNCKDDGKGGPLASAVYEILY